MATLSHLNNDSVSESSQLRSVTPDLGVENGASAEPNSPFDYEVPQTPKICYHHHAKDQQVPLTPTSQKRFRTPASVPSFPSTPISSPHSPLARHVLRVSQQEDGTASQSTMDQMVPSTPKSTNRTTQERLDIQHRTTSFSPRCSQSYANNTFHTSARSRTDRTYSHSMSQETISSFSTVQQTRVRLARSRRGLNEVSSEILSENVSQFSQEGLSISANTFSMQQTNQDQFREPLNQPFQTSRETTALSQPSTSCLDHDSANNNSYSQDASHVLTREEITQIRRSGLQIRRLHISQASPQQYQQLFFNDDDDAIFT